LLKQWPSYLAFLTSFALIGIMWINHHKLFSLIKRSDHLLLVFNALLLLGATVVPFTTSLLAEYIGHGEQRVAAMVYMGNFLVIAIFFNLIWRYAAHSHRLLAHDVSEDEVRSINRAYILGPPVYLLCFVIAYFSVPLALGMTIALVYFMPCHWAPTRANGGYIFHQPHSSRLKQACSKTCNCRSSTVNE